MCVCLHACMRVWLEQGSTLFKSMVFLSQGHQIPFCLSLCRSLSLRLAFSLCLCRSLSFSFCVCICLCAIRAQSLKPILCTIDFPGWMALVCCSSPSSPSSAHSITITLRIRFWCEILWRHIEICILKAFVYVHLPVCVVCLIICSLYMYDIYHPGEI